MLVCHRLHPPVFVLEMPKSCSISVVPRQATRTAPTHPRVAIVENAAQKRFPREGEERSVLVKWNFIQPTI